MSVILAASLPGPDLSLIEGAHVPPARHRKKSISGGRWRQLGDRFPKRDGPVTRQAFGGQKGKRRYPYSVSRTSTAGADASRAMVVYNKYQAAANAAHAFARENKRGAAYSDYGYDDGMQRDSKPAQRAFRKEILDIIAIDASQQRGDRNEPLFHVVAPYTRQSPPGVVPLSVYVPNDNDPTPTPFRPTSIGPDPPLNGARAGQPLSKKPQQDWERMFLFDVTRPWREGAWEPYTSMSGGSLYSGGRKERSDKGKKRGKRKPRLTNPEMALVPSDVHGVVPPQPELATDDASWQWLGKTRSEPGYGDGDVYTDPYGPSQEDLLLSKSSRSGGVAGPDKRLDALFGATKEEKALIKAERALQKKEEAAGRSNFTKNLRSAADILKYAVPIIGVLGTAGYKAYQFINEVQNPPGQAAREFNQVITSQTLPYAQRQQAEKRERDAVQRLNLQLGLQASAAAPSQQDPMGVGVLRPHNRLDAPASRLRSLAPRGLDVTGHIERHGFWAVPVKPPANLNADAFNGQRDSLVTALTAAPVQSRPPHGNAYVNSSLQAPQNVVGLRVPKSPAARRQIEYKTPSQVARQALDYAASTVIPKRGTSIAARYNAFPYEVATQPHTDFYQNYGKAHRRGRGLRRRRGGATDDPKETRWQRLRRYAKYVLPALAIAGTAAAIGRSHYNGSRPIPEFLTPDIQRQYQYQDHKRNYGPGYVAAREERSVDDLLYDADRLAYGRGLPLTPSRNAVLNQRFSDQKERRNAVLQKRRPVFR